MMHTHATRHWKWCLISNVSPFHIVHFLIILQTPKPDQHQEWKWKLQRATKRGNPEKCGQAIAKWCTRDTLHWQCVSVLSIVIFPLQFALILQMLCFLRCVAVAVFALSLFHCHSISPLLPLPLLLLLFDAMYVEALKAFRMNVLKPKQRHRVRQKKGTRKNVMEKVKHEYEAECVCAWVQKTAEHNRNRIAKLQRIKQDTKQDRKKIPHSVRPANTEFFIPSSRLFPFFRFCLAPHFLRCVDTFLISCLQSVTQQDSGSACI